MSPPLTEIGKDEYVRMDGHATGFTGGLYPGGSNERPAAHREAGLAAAAQIQPLSEDGQVDPENGKIGMISIGMSNTQMEFGQFINENHNNNALNPKLVLVNGALGGQTAERWEDPQALAWQELSARVKKARLSPLQVQVAWIKQTLTRGGDFPEKAQELEGYLESIARNLKTHYPNLRIAYYSSRTRSYTYFRGLSPEPLAFETGFAVKWLIEKQIEGDPSLNFDPQAGEVRAPYLTWGPYLWIDGEHAREDGRVWLAEDLAKDCTHPSNSGKEKVAEMLLEFFSKDETAASWFLAVTPAKAVERATLTVAATPTEVKIAAGSPTPTPGSTLMAVNPTTFLERTQAAAPTVIPEAPPQQEDELSSSGPSTALTVGAALALGMVLIAGWVIRRQR